MWISKAVSLSRAAEREGASTDMGVTTIGGGSAEAAVIQKAVQIMERESPLPMTHQIDITGRTAEDEGMVCGGIVDFLLEYV